MRSLIFSCLFLSSNLVSSSPIAASPQNNNATPIVRLDYGTFQGAQSSEYNLTYYRKIPFGASTAGRNRFRAPQSPLPVNGTYDTDQSFDMCPQRTVNGSEDCLYLGVYSRPWSASSQPLRPVLLTFYGGGFIQGSATFTIPPSGFPVLNANDFNDYVVVYSNYRTNLFGFLSGSKIQQDEYSDLNPGLLDQGAALEWIQKNIHHFGGDKANVTIWGQSAGGGSVVAQAIAQGNKGKGLFTKAMSSSPYWPKTYRYDAPENENLYDRVVEGVGCKSERGEDEVKCLKSVDVQVLRSANLKIIDSAKYTTSTFSWGPVIDEDFLSAPLSEVAKDSGELNAEMVLTTYNLHEGENFIPPGFSNSTGDSNGFNASRESFGAWLVGYLPGLDAENLDELKSLYPQSGSAEAISWNDTYTRAGMVYRDLQLACPAYWLANKADKGWLIEYTISPAKHASDTIYWNQVNQVQKTDPLTYDGFTGAMASFIQTGNPNAHKITNSSVPGVPSMHEGEQFLVTEQGLQNGEIDMLEKRCGFWLRVSDKVPV